MRRRIALCSLLLCLPLAVSGQLKIAGEAAEGYWGDGINAQLARAAAEGRVEDVKRLVKGGAQVNVVGKQNMTPLVWALTARNPAGMRALLELGADPNQRVGPEKQFHPVWLAAGQDQPEQLRVLLEFKGDPNAPHKGADYVPLLRVLGAGPSALTNTQLLVKSGADINASDQIGNPFILDASSLGHYDIILFALQNGYNNNLPLLAWDVERRRPDGKAPLPSELEPKRRQVLEELKKMGVRAPPGPAPKLEPRQ